MKWLIAAAVVGVVGALTLAFGLRGRRVDRHPCCRRCGYDLTGTDDPGSCPECGARLTRRRAVRVGHRRVRRAPAILGVLLLAAGLAAGGTKLWPSLRAFDWNTVKPVWLLVREADRGTSLRADAAREELIARLEGGRLGEDRIRQLADAALARQADLTQPWPAQWGTFVEMAWYERHLDDEVIRSYLRGAFAEGVILEASPRAVTGGPIAFAASVPSARGAADTSLFTASFRFTDVTIDERRARIDRSDNGRWTLVPLAMGVGDRRFTGEANAFAPTGDHELSVGSTLMFSLRSGVRPGAKGAPKYSELWRNPSVGSGGGSGDGHRHPPPPRLFFEHPARLAQPLCIVEHERDVLSVVDDPALAAPLRASIVCRAVEVHAPPGGIVRLTADLAISEPPVDAVFDVSVRVGPTEVPLRPTIAAVDGGIVEEKLRGQLSSTLRDVMAADLILRSPAQALANVASDRPVWEGRIVLENVPVSGPDPNRVPPPAESTRSAPRPLRHKPLDELLRIAEPMAENVVAAVLTELSARVAEGAVDDIASLVDVALRRQANPDAPWSPGWGDLVECAWAGGQLRDDQLDRYVRQALASPIALHLRPRVRAGEEIPFAVRLPRLRGGRGSPVRLGLEFIPVAVTVDGADSRFERVQARRQGLFGRDETRPRRVRDERTGASDRDLTGALPPISGTGRHRVEMRWQVRAVEMPQRGSRTWRHPPPRSERPPPALSAWTVETAAEMEVVPAAALAVDLDATDDTVARVLAALHAHPVTARRERDGERTRLSGEIDITDAPVALSCDVLLRIGGSLVPAGRALVPAGTERDRIRVRARLDVLDPDLTSVAIVLRPRPGPAEATVSIVEILGAEIVLPDVPLEFAVDR